MSISTKNNWGKELGDQQISISKTKKHSILQIKKPFPKGISFPKFQANGNLGCRTLSATMQNNRYTRVK